MAWKYFLHNDMQVHYLKQKADNYAIYNNIKIPLRNKIASSKLKKKNTGYPVHLKIKKQYSLSQFLYPTK